MQAQPLSGGQLLGNGRMWVSPSGELDPRAVKVRFEGRNLPTETLLKRYLPKVSPRTALLFPHTCTQLLLRAPQEPAHVLLVLLSIRVSDGKTHLFSTGS